jgi:hypothetical protein
MAKKAVKKKKQSTSVSVKKSKKAPQFETFRMSEENDPFLSFRITDQTIYWSVLLILVLVLSIWILNVQLDTLRIIDSIVI